MGADWALGFMPYGNRWRIHRRLFHRFFNASAIERLDPQLFKGIRRFLRQLAESPEDFADHTRLYVTFRPRCEPKVQALTSFQRLGGSLILSIAYGIEANSQENQFFANAQQATHSLGPTLLPGAFLVDWIPLRTRPFECICQAPSLTLQCSQAPSRLATWHRIP